MREYPKIETVYVRDERTRKVDATRLRLPEFGLIREWYITEKIDGTNIRIGLTDAGALDIRGRTDAAQVPTPVLSHLMETFKPDALRAKFPDGSFALFGEAYGPKIQNGGDYSPVPRFRLFDVLVGDWWLEPDGIADVAATFGIPTVPFLCMAWGAPQSTTSLREVLSESRVPAEDGGKPRQAEGIVARTVPGLMTRKGDRLMWKLKFKDFPV